MAEVSWSNDAIANLELIIDFVDQHDPAAAQRLGRRLIAAAESLASFPHRGRLAGNGCRELVVVRPFIIRYTVRGDRVFVLRLRHAAQLPDSD